MGATESKIKLLNQKSILKYDKLDIPDIDKLFDEAFVTITEIEIIRCEFIQRWNEFVRLTGAIVLQNPKFDSCVQGMLWKFAVDMMGNLSSIEILQEEPFIKINNLFLFKEEDIVISRSFQDLCRFYFSNFDKVGRLEGQMNKYDREGKDFIKDPESLLGNRNVESKDIFAYSKKLSLNVKKAHIAYEIIFLIRNSFDDIRRGLQRYTNWMKDHDQVKRFEEVGILANSKNITKPAKIMYNYTKEEKLPSYDDHIDILQDDLRAEKEARAVLESSSIRGTFILTYSKYSEKIEQQTIESLKEKALTEESIEEKGQRIPTSASIESQVSDPGKIYIFGDKEIRPLHKVHEDYELQQEKENINVIMRNPVTEAYEHTFAKSEVIKLKPKERLLRKTKSNILPRIESIKAFEMRREIKELRRKNKELTAQVEARQLETRLRLDQSDIPAQIKEEINSTQNLPVKFERSIPQSQPKLRTSLKQTFPIKNWNLIPKKTVTSDRKQKIYCIESATDLELVITGDDIGKLTFWRYGDFVNITEQKIMEISQGPIRSLLYLNDGKTLFCGCDDGSLYKIDMTIFTAKFIIDLKSSINSLVYLYDGSTIIAASGNNIYTIDALKERILNKIEAHDSGITELAYNYKKDILASSSNDKTIKIWNPQTKEYLGVLRGHAKEINSICFAFTQKHFYIISCANDSYITFWNLSDKNLTRTVKMNSTGKKVIYLHDKKTVLSLNKNGSLTLWNLEKDTDKKELSFQKIGYLSGAYLGDGYNLVLGSEDGRLEFWNAVANEQTA